MRNLSLFEADRLTLDDAIDLSWAQTTVTASRYLRAPVDPRARPMAYIIRDASQPAPAHPSPAHRANTAGHGGCRARSGPGRILNVSNHVHYVSYKEGNHARSAR